MSRRGHRACVVGGTLALVVFAAAVLACANCRLVPAPLALQYELWNMKNRNLKVCAPFARLKRYPYQLLCIIVPWCSSGSGAACTTLAALHSHLHG